MSIRQLCPQLDSVLETTFLNTELPFEDWFGAMEEIVKRNLPRRYANTDTFEVVLAYVKWKRAVTVANEF